MKEVVRGEQKVQNHSLLFLSLRGYSNIMKKKKKKYEIRINIRKMIILKIRKSFVIFYAHKKFSYVYKRERESERGKN